LELYLGAGLLAEFDIDRKIEKEFDKPKKIERRIKDANDRKTYDEVFDQATLLIIYKLISDNILSTVDYPISSGKEANIFKGTTPKGDPVALKIYRLATATFKNIIRYIDGDTRFKNVKRNHRSIIFAWANKEFRNLQRMNEFSIRVPTPMINRKNILIMEFIGADGLPAPELRRVKINRPATKFKKIIEQIKILYSEAGLVHGDLSEYNILVIDDELVIIDVGQSVLHNHPLAKRLMVNDINNITRYFIKTYKIKVNTEKVVDEILKLREDD
jgi:RIO kinase 1